tara:strand:+ start:44 stop:607 length:564 start_codon:yes stop_codon:yes gene_type:complete
MKYLIIGLGNPGTEYNNTRHNIGFKVLDALVSLTNNSYISDRYADICETKYKGRKLILVKPTTFMNLSGKAVKYWMQKTNVNKENLLVITDDISLPFGSLRLRKKGSDGGHNGLGDIQQEIGGDIYPRLRFGIGNNYVRGGQANYVLSSFNEEELKIINERIDIAIKMLKAFTTIGIDRTMSDYNGK